jgi:uncharacterized protein DUF1843
MPARKTTKASTKKASAKVGPQPPYGIAIREAMARGNAQEMKAAAARGRKHLADVRAALAKLEARIKKAGS